MKKTTLSLLKIVFLMLACFSVMPAVAQLTDIARIEYSFIPKTKSEDEYTRFRALLNYPIKIGGDSYFVIGGEYNRIMLELEDDYPFDTSEIDRIHVLDLNLAYTFKTCDDCRIGLQFNPRMASTLTHKITMEDLFLNGGVFYIKDRTDATDIKRPYRLVLGLTYNTTAGVPFPLPFVSYYRRISDRWAMNLGVPKTNFNLHLNDKNMIQIFASLDGYFANVQGDLVVEGKSVDNISLSVAVMGLGYEYDFSKHLAAYIYTGYTLRLQNVLRESDRSDIFTLDQLNAFYLRTGFKFQI